MPAYFVILIVAVSIGAFMQSARADSPTSFPNPNSSVTVRWDFTDKDNITVDNATVQSGAAHLATANSTISWSKGPDFAANQSQAENTSIDASGVALSANMTNRIPDGDFGARGSWTFANGTTWPYRVNATWSPAAGAALLQHTSPATEAPWQSMEARANWSWYSPNATGQVYAMSGGIDGDGMLGMNISSHPHTSFWASAVWNLLSDWRANVNWSGFDRLVLWVMMNVTEPVSLNLTAHVANSVLQLTTPALPVSANWHEISFNLSQLGTAIQRRNLSSVFLRVNAQSSLPPFTWIFFDDARVGVAKVFTSDAQVSLTFVKRAGSTRLPGSASLSFDWCLCNASGVFRANPYYRLAGPGGQVAGGLAPPAGGTWSRYSQDVSANVTAAGEYTITFGLTVQANDTAASNATMWVDNATFLFPDRNNGTYLSVPVSFGADAQPFSMMWSAALPPPTAMRISLRTGNGSSTWSAWQSWSRPGTAVVTLPPARWFQVAVALNTTNASVTPVLQAFSVSTWTHRIAGSITSELAPVRTNFLRWRSMACTMDLPAGTAVAFEVGNGSSWTPVGSDWNLTSYPGPYLEWRATLSTNDAMLTPVLTEVNVTYEFLGPIATVAMSPQGILTLPSGSSIQFSARALDSGRHLLQGIPFAWATTDPSGTIDNTGKYTAGTPGLWNVTATAVGLGIVQTVQVRVVPGGLSGLWPYALLAALAALGIAIYQVAVRRMFAIDDVFLIAKDGRLILHNTRRMRADRDEDILSGMLTAIMAFLRDSDPEENGELKRFAVGGKTTLLERGKHAYLSAIYSGRVPRWAARDLHRFMNDLEDRFGEAFATWNGSPEELHDVKQYMERFVAHVRYRRRPDPRRTGS